MKPRSWTAVAAILIAPFIYADSPYAELEHWPSVTRMARTLSTEAHPKKMELALMVMERQEIESVGIAYVLKRWTHCDIYLKEGGKMIGTLKLITAAGTQKVGKKKTDKCRNHLLDTESAPNQKRCGLQWRLKTVLEPGDVVLWEIKFKKMPALEREACMDGNSYWDQFTLGGGPYPDGWLDN